MTTSNADIPDPTGKMPEPIQTSNDWAGTNFVVDNHHQAAADFLRAVDLEPNPDAIEQLADAFLPCLRIICTRGHASDGSLWKEAGWRGLLSELIKKMDRVQFLDWLHMMDASHELPDIINYAAMLLRSRHSIPAYGPKFGEPGPWGGVDIPIIVTLCGSTRFAHLFRKINLEQTLHGRIVLSIGCDSNSDADLDQLHEIGMSIIDAKPGLDKLHKRKIDLSSMIIVISDDSGYIGDSTRGEIEYALMRGKTVQWMSAASRAKFYAS
jgi:hypothetical protein